MGKNTEKVHLMIHGFRRLGEKGLAEEFFQMLEETGNEYLPCKVGIGEPIKIPYSKENANKIWLDSEKELHSGGGISFKGLTEDNAYGDIDWNNDGSNSLSLRISMKYLNDNNGVEKFINLTKKLFVWLNAVYGFGAHSSQDHYTPGLNYRICMWGISWMALFGSPYVKMFGRDVIKTAPCKVEEFGENRFMLLTSDRPRMKDTELIDKQQKVKKHLGEDAFYRNEPRKTTLTMEDLRAGKNRPSREGYRSPDLSAYIKDFGITKDEGLIAKVNEDGSIATYKVKPEKN